MRKSLLSFLALLLMSFPLLAQNESDDGKASAGSVTVEVTGSPFNAGGVASGVGGVGNTFLHPGVLRVRYFLSDELAVRFSTWANMNSNQTSPEVVENSAFFSVRPGVEYRLGAGNDKLSTYVGGEVLFENRITSMESSTMPGITGATNTNGGNRGFWQAGVMGVAGADYYFNSKFYFGVEVGLQYAYRSNADVVLGGEATLFRKTVSHNFNAVVSNTLRLGFIF